MKISRIFAFCATAGLLISCQQFDDSALNSRIDDLDAKLQSIEAQINQLKKDVANINDLVNALNENVYVKNVTATADGWDVLLSNNKTLNIKNGANGSNGTTVGIAKDTDGIYYWTLNGEFIVVDGHKLQVEGKDGFGTKPEFKIEENNLYVSYDSKASWEKVGEVGSGTAVTPAITDVTEADGKVTFTLAGGNTIILAKEIPLSLKITGPASMDEGETADFSYEVSGGDATTVVVAVAQGNWKASVAGGKINVTAPATWEDGQILVFATASGKVTMSVISISKKIHEAPAVSVTDNTINAPMEGGTYNIPVIANFVPEVSTSDSWMTCVATKADTYNYTLTVEANTGAARSGSLTFKNTENTVSAIVTVNQAEHSASWEAVSIWPIQSTANAEAYKASWVAGTPSKGVITVAGAGTITLDHSFSVAAGTDNSNNNKLDISKSSSSTPKANNPRVYGSWEGDNWTFESETGAKAGDKVRIYFEFCGSATTMRYWKMEYLDGTEWKTVGTPKSFNQGGVDKFYTHEFATPNTSASDPQYNVFEGEATLSADVAKITFKLTAVGTIQTDGITERFPYEAGVDGHQGTGGWYMLIASSSAAYPHIEIYR